MNALFKTVSLLMLVSLCCQCGRKQRTLFQFPQQAATPINKLTLPAVRGLRAISQNNDILLTWQPADFSSSRDPQHAQLRLVGYHVYRFVKGRFVVKHPITKEPVTATQFLDTSRLKNKQPFCYLIRAVFANDNQVIQGPASYITSAKIS